MGLPHPRRLRMRTRIPDRLPPFSPPSRCSPQELSRYFPVIKVMLDAVYFLIIFVPFARDQDEIAVPGFRKGQGDRGPAVGLDECFCSRIFQPREYFGDDGIRVFRARIVRSNNSHIRSFTHDVAHNRALGAVTVTAAAENNYYAFRIEAPGGRDEVLQAIRRMSVIHHYVKAPLRGNRLKSTWHRLQG